MKRWLCRCALLFLSATIGARGAAAADPDGLIRRGVELRREAKDAEALILFQQAYELQESSKALAQMGLAEQALGKWGAADRHLRQSLDAPDDGWLTKHRQAIDAAQKAIAPHVGRLEVRGSPVGAQVRVDGELVGALPLLVPISVNAGGVAIEVRAPGHLTILRASTVPPGMLVRESFELQPLSPSMESQSRADPAGWATADMSPQRPAEARAASAPASAAAHSARSWTAVEPDAVTESPRAGASNPPAASSGSARTVFTLGAAGLAVGALAFAIIEHVAWQNKTGQFQTMAGCDPALQHRGSTACERLYDDGTRAKYLAIGGYSLTAGLAATAAILFFTAPSAPPDPRQVACLLNPTVPGLDCSLRF